jgi:phytoene desaturase
VWHPRGGFGAMATAMLEAYRQRGGTTLMSTAVSSVVVEKGRVRGVRLADGRMLRAPAVVINADFTWAQRLLPATARRTWSDRRLSKMHYSCSSLCIYLGLEGALDIPHHFLYLAEAARKQREGESDEMLVRDDPPFYLCHPSRTDPTMAPADGSVLTILVPIPNGRAGLDWSSIEPAYGDFVLDHVARVMSIPDLKRRIRFQHRHDVRHWENEYNVGWGAIFNFAHSLAQFGPRRPHMVSEDVENLYWVGGGTHPGSGLLTIFENAMQVASCLSSSLRPIQPLPDESLLGQLLAPARSAAG